MQEIQCTLMVLTRFDIASKPEMDGKDQAIGGKIVIDNQRRLFYLQFHIYTHWHVS